MRDIGCVTPLPDTSSACGDGATSHYLEPVFLTISVQPVFLKRWEVCVVAKDVQAVLARSSNLINLLAVLATLNSFPETLLFVELKNVHNSRISQRGISRRHITVS